ncbi:hypothetical protein D3C81_2024340 [compost metagenome]
MLTTVQPSRGDDLDIINDEMLILCFQHFVQAGLIVKHLLASHEPSFNPTPYADVVPMRRQRSRHTMPVC